MKGWIASVRDALRPGDMRGAGRRILRGLFLDLKVGGRLVLAFVVVLVMAWVALAGFLYWNQEYMIFHPSKTAGPPPRIPGYECAERELAVPALDGVFAAWHLKKPGGRRCVVYLGGNAESVADAAGRLAVLARDLDCSVFAIDYPGYGKNPGKPGEKAIRTLVEAWARELTGPLGYAPGDLVIWGRSLGGGAAVQLAEVVGPGALVLESTFTSVADFAGAAYPFIPVRLLCKHPFLVRERLSGLRVPLLVAHGPEDEVIPFPHGRKNFEGYSGGRKEFVELAGGHNGPGLAGDPGRLRRLAAFLGPVAGSGHPAPTMTDEPEPGVTP